LKHIGARTKAQINMQMHKRNTTAVHSTHIRSAAS